MDHQPHKGSESSQFNFPDTETDATKKSLEPENEGFGVIRTEEASAGQAIEQGRISTPSQSSSSTALPVDFPTNPLLTNAPPIPATGSTSSPSATSNLVAEDKDVIEKVWVEKAKAIINSTRTDPHKQTDEINKIKADYQKKRYNRDLKINVE